MEVSSNTFILNQNTHHGINPIEGHEKQPQYAPPGARPLAVQLDYRLEKIHSGYKIYECSVLKQTKIIQY